MAALDELAGGDPSLSRPPAHPPEPGRVAYVAAPGPSLLEPLGYLDFLAGAIRRPGPDRFRWIQEETTYLGIPCLTVRTTTERPVTITQGTNRLVLAESV